ncbi:MAG: ribosome recycling factor [Simkaniaceae bacterium]
MSIVDETKNKMQAALDFFLKDLRGLRTGRPNPAMIENVMVEAYGTEMRLKDLATIAVSEPRQLLVTPFDANTAGPIAKGIESANLNLQPQAEGNIIRIPFPPLNEQTRKDLVKQAKKKGEDAKISIRNIRREGNDTLKKLKTSGEITEDMQKKMEKKIQENTDKFCKEIDEFVTKKEKEIMEV